MTDLNAPIPPKWYGGPMVDLWYCV